jgi:hypothetical protein
MNPDLRRLVFAVVLAAVALAPAGADAQGLVPRWGYKGNEVSAHLGWSLASGDWNGDGYGDLAVGIPLADRGEVDEGLVFVFFGELAGLAPEPAFSVESNQAGAMFGYALINAGDVDFDGFDDLVVGAPRFSNGQPNEGAIFIYSGSESGLIQSGFREMNQAGALFGAALAGPGDFDLDGSGDVAVGAPRWSNGQAAEGRAFVYRSDFFNGLEALPAFGVESNQAGAHLGHALAFTDSDGDFFSDLAIAAPEWNGVRPHEGRVTIHRGTEDGLEAAPTWTLTGGGAGARFGRSLAPLEDVDGNGFNDLIVGAPGWGVPGRVKGAVFVYLGDEAGLRTSPWWALEGDQLEAGVGYAVADIGDIDEDGFSDFAIGAPGARVHVPAEGRVAVYLGNEQGSTPTLGDVVPGEQPGGAFGIAISKADPIRDYRTELAVGGLHFAGGIRSEGLARLYSLGYTTTGVSLTPSAPGIGLAIERIFPNPSRHRMNVSFVVPAEARGALSIVDISGRRRIHRDLGILAPGRQSVEALSGTRLEPGLYFVRLEVGRRTVTAKATVLE